MKRTSIVALLPILVLAVGGACAPASPSASHGWTPGAPAAGAALDAREQEVAHAVDAIFDAMRAGDAAALRDLFQPGATLTSVSDRDASPVLNSTPMAAFIDAVGAPRDEVWDERIWDLEVKVDGALASAWMQYAFHLDDRLSHCGVNSMQLFRSSEGWKVIHVADTRRREGCVVPAAAR